MNKLTLSLFFAMVVSSAANAASSTCVIFIENDLNPLTVQSSCDGAALADLFTVSGVTAGISKATSYYMDMGYTLGPCTDTYVQGVNNTTGPSYSRCIYTKK